MIGDVMSVCYVLFHFSLKRFHLALRLNVITTCRNNILFVRTLLIYARNCIKFSANTNHKFDRLKRNYIRRVHMLVALRKLLLHVDQINLIIYTILANKHSYINSCCKAFFRFPLTFFSEMYRRSSTSQTFGIWNVHSIPICMVRFFLLCKAVSLMCQSNDHFNYNHEIESVFPN